MGRCVDSLPGAKSCGVERLMFRIREELTHGLNCVASSWLVGRGAQSRGMLKVLLTTCKDEPSWDLNQEYRKDAVDY